MKKVKTKKVKGKDIIYNGPCRNQTYTFRPLDDGRLVPVDPTYPLTGPGVHSSTGGKP